MDMTEDIFATYSYGKVALKKMAPTHDNFRLYQAECLGQKEKAVMKVTGAEFRIAKSGPYKGKLSILVKGTKRTEFVTREEMKLAMAEFLNT